VAGTRRSARRSAPRRIIAYIDGFRLLMSLTIASFPLLLFFAVARPRNGESPTIAH
jgi:hypothetical protein